MMDQTDHATAVQRRQRNKLLYLNLADLLEECKASGMAVIKRKLVSRSWIAERIGCTAAVLSNSPRLRNYLKRWEERNLAGLRNSAPTEPPRIEMAEDNDSNVVLFSKRADDGRILMVPYRKTRRTLIEIPTLIWHQGIDVEISDYLRHLVLKFHLAPSSAEEYGKVLRIFSRYRRNLGLAWSDVDDNVFLAWQASMLGADIPVPRRNYCITVVHGFYRWAEQTGRLKYHVCVGRPYDYPKDMFGYKFPIASVEVRVRQGRRWVVRWQSPLTERIGHGGYGFRNTPNSTQLMDLFATASISGRHAVRNHLMMSWALECGARLDELLQPTLSDLPTEDQIWNLDDSDLWVIKVKRKGQKRKEGKLLVTVDLILRTYDYVRHERKDVVARCLAAGKKVSDFVFISERSGDVLQNDSVTRICGEIFRATRIEKANIHRLRASFITQQVERCLLAVEAMGNSVDMTSTWHETILTMAAQLMGHTSILSLRPYLNQLLVRRLQTELGTSDVGEAELIESIKIQRFAAENAELIRALRLRMLGKFKEASEILLAHGAEAKRLSENLLPLAA